MFKNFLSKNQILGGGILFKKKTNSETVHVDS